MRRLAVAALVAAAVCSSHAEERVDFEREVLPVLQESCFKCHATEHKGRKRRPKAGLRLDGKGYFLRGGNSGVAVVAGEPGRSLLYGRITLPDDHDDVMPPDGDVLDAGKRATIRRWIAEGADFGSWTGAGGPGPVAHTTETDAPASDRFELYRKLAGRLGPAPGAGVKAARAAGARVEPVFPGSPLLRVEFLADPRQGTDAAVKGLAALRNHVAMLGLAESRVTDAALGEIGKMPRLVRLDLQRTAVTDAGLKALGKAKPPALQRLNLYGTGVTDAGLDGLAPLTGLRALYLWDTKVTTAGAAELRRLLPDCTIQRERVLPGAEAPGDDERGGRRNRRKKN